MSSHTETDLDRLPFTEYARVVAERGAKEHGGDDDLRRPRSQ